MIVSTLYLSFVLLGIRIDQDGIVRRKDDVGLEPLGPAVLDPVPGGAEVDDASQGQQEDENADNYQSGWKSVPKSSSCRPHSASADAGRLR